MKLNRRFVVTFILCLLLIGVFAPCLNFLQITTVKADDNFDWIGSPYTSLYNVTAASGSMADIETAIADVVANGEDGEGNVFVPSGVWASAYTASNRIDVQGGVNIFGAGWSGNPEDGTGQWQTTLNFSQEGDDAAMIFRLDGSNDKASRIAGLAMKGWKPSTYANKGANPFQIYDMIDFRIDHCMWANFGYGGFVWGNTTQGVLDHNEVHDQTWSWGTFETEVHIGYGAGITDSYSFDETWYDPEVLAGNATGVTYIEDNWISGVRHAMVAFGSSSYVARYNTFTEMHVMGYDSGFCDVHGAYSSGGLSGQWVEIYNNTFYLNWTYYDDNPDVWYGDGEAAYDHVKAFLLRGGRGLIYNNTVNDMQYALKWSTDDGNPEHTQCYPHDYWIWSNTLNNVSALIGDGDLARTEEVDYYLHAPNASQFTYTPYVYPHPLVSSEEATYTLSLTITNPQNTTYSSASVPVALSVSGNDTNPVYSWNAKFSNGTWLYGSNQTSTSTTMTIDENATNVLFACYVEGDNGASDYDEVTFSVEIIIVYTLSVSWVTPTATTYDSSTVAFSTSVSGNETGVTYQIQLYNASVEVYGSNFTTASGNFTGLVNGTYTAAVFVSGDHGETDYAEVEFTVEIPAAVYTLSLTITDPQAITYTSSSISVALSVSGNDTNPTYSWNFQFSNGTWLYETNQTGTSATMTITENCTGVFACYAIGENLASDYGEVALTVLLTDAPEPTPTPNPARPIIDAGLAALGLLVIIPIIIIASLLFFLLMGKGDSENVIPAIVSLIGIVALIIIGVWIVNAFANIM